MKPTPLPGHRSVCTAPHQEFLAFLKTTLQVHVILDNYSTHKLSEDDQPPF